MIPSAWGPIIHDALFLIAMSYPVKPSEEKIVGMRILIEQLFWNLPCEMCSSHAKELLQKTPPTINSREEFVEWCVKYHNAINKKTGKDPEWTVEEAKSAFISRMYKNTTIGDLNSNQYMRREDTKKILDLRHENSLMSKKLGMEGSKFLHLEDINTENLDRLIDGSVTLGTDQSDLYDGSDTLNKVIIVLVSIILLLLTIFMIYYLRKHARRK